MENAEDRFGVLPTNSHDGGRCRNVDLNELTILKRRVFGRDTKLDFNKLSILTKILLEKYNNLWKAEVVIVIVDIRFKDKKKQMTVTDDRAWLGQCDISINWFCL